MNILICDDDTNIFSSIKREIMLNTKTTHYISCIDSHKKLTDLLGESGRKYDLLIIDICLGEENGIDIAFLIKNKYPEIKIIFISGYDDYYEKIFLKVKPFAFIKKPINFDMLRFHINRVDSIVSERKQSAFSIDTKSIRATIPYDEIVFFESQQRVISVHTLTDTFRFYGKLEEIIQTAPPHFIKCHKSYLVNGYYIRSYQKSQNVLVMINDSVIKVSRSKTEIVNNTLLKISSGM